MAWNGSGGFDRLYNWQTDKAGGIKIRADRMDGEFDNYASGLENCVTRDGQNSPTNNLPMGGFKHTNVSEGTSRTEYASVSQVQDGKNIYGTTSGTANAITVTMSPPINSYTLGQVFLFIPTADNTDAVTIDFGAGALTLRNREGGTTLGAGALQAGVAALVAYNGTDFTLLSNEVSLNGTQTLSNKTLSSPTINTPTITGGTQSSPTIIGPTLDYPLSGNGLDGDNTFASPSDSRVPTTLAMKTYVDNQVTGKIYQTATYDTGVAFEDNLVTGAANGQVIDRAKMSFRVSAATGTGAVLGIRVFVNGGVVIKAPIGAYSIISSAGGGVVDVYDQTNTYLYSGLLASNQETVVGTVEAIVYSTAIDLHWTASQRYLVSGNWNFQQYQGNVRLLPDNVTNISFDGFRLLVTNGVATFSTRALYETIE